MSWCAILTLLAVVVVYEIVLACFLRAAMGKKAPRCPERNGK